MAKIVEVRFMRKENVRAVCINHDWYNRGSNEEYAAMFAMWNPLKNVTVEILEKVARDIMDHSSEEVMEYYDVCSVMNALADECCMTCFVEEN